MNDILFIGDCGNYTDTSNGVYAKNLQLLARLKELYPNVRHVNTNGWKKNPLVLLNVFMSLWKFRHKHVIISLNTISAYKLIKATSLIIPSIKINYFVIGGILPDFIKNMSAESRKPYRIVKWFMVESESMKTCMNKLGYDNVLHVPNFKKISFIPQKTHSNNDVFKFVFLSRIIPEKGCDLIFDAVKKLHAKIGRGKFTVHFFGKIDEQYKAAFLKSIDNTADTEYKGFLWLGDTSNYSVLATYSSMLFPTYWKGEGFPGILIDAMIAGTPVIASEWGYNTEIISHNQTGLIIPSKDSDALSDAMLQLIDNRQKVAYMSSKCQEYCTKYDTDNILTERLFCTIFK